MAFSDSNDVSSISCVVTESTILLDVDALRRLSDTLESVFLADIDNYADAKLVVGCGKEIPVHRCILSVRSSFFRSLFVSRKSDVKFEVKELMKEYEVGYEALVIVLGFIYSGKVSVPPKDVVVCVDDECVHLSCRPAVMFGLELLYASFVFRIEELVARFQCSLMGILDMAISDDILMVLSVANICGSACALLRARCIEIIVNSDVDIISLEKALPHQLVEQIQKTRVELGIQSPESNGYPDKHVKRIHRALDSHDVELVRMLLKEERTSLDDACALHYAVAYCDAKTTTELLDLGIADINHRNIRDYTVLHVAAMRKEPNIVVSLLTKGARPTDLTSDGRKALQISKRLTRAVDYNRDTEEGKATSKDRLCVEILEQAESRAPLLGEASVSLAMAGDDLRSKLNYLENRVALAKILFPVEAKVAMDIAQVDGTSEFPVNGDNKNTSARRTAVDLNEAPFKIKDEHLNRLTALSKTVELGKRYFPRCSDVLNTMMDGDECPDAAELNMDSVEDCSWKRQRTMELEEAFSKAFTEDKEEYDLNMDSVEDCPWKRQRTMELGEAFSKAFTEDKEEYDRTINLPASSSSLGGRMKPNSKFTLRK